MTEETDQWIEDSDFSQDFEQNFRSLRPRRRSSQVRKFDKLRPWPVRLHDEQRQMLHEVEQTIMASRSWNNREERITKATVVRAWLEVFAYLWTEADIREVANEEELVQRLWALIDPELAAEVTSE